MPHPLFQLVRRSCIIIVAAIVGATSAHGQSAIWGDRGTFPHRAVMLILECESREWNLRNGRSVGNDLAEERAVRELKREIAGLTGAHRGERVMARLSVQRVSNGTLFVCPDVSWGWPTQAMADVMPENPYEAQAEKCNAVTLKMNGSKEDALAVALGGETPETFAKQVVWNDKVLVEFTVDSIQRVRRPKKATNNDDGMFGGAGAEEIDDAQRPYFEVRIRDPKFVKAVPPAEGERPRPRLWPTPGTLPQLYQQLLAQIGTSGDRFEVEDRIRSFAEYVSRYDPRGIAIGKIGVVTDKFVVLQPELDVGDFPLSVTLTPPLEELQRQPEVGVDAELEKGLKVPVASIGRERAIKFKAGDRVLIAFRVTSLSPEVSRAIDGRIRGEIYVAATDLQLGTDEQLLAYLPAAVVPEGGAGASAAAIIAATPTAPLVGTLHASSDPSNGGGEESAGAIWGRPGSFPEVVKQALTDRKSPNVSGVEGKRVKASLSVIEVTPTEVRLLPDATWGFPILPADEVTGSFQQHHSVIRLQGTGVAERTERIALTIGAHISEEQAKKLGWNDKVVVDFRVDGVEFSPPAESPDLSSSYGRSDYYARQSPTAVAEPRESCVVQISGVRFVKAEQDKLLASLRSPLWPGPGTPPFMFNLAKGGKGFEHVGERSPYTDFASFNVFRASAVFEVEEVDGGEVRFDGRPLISLSKHADLQLGDGGDLVDGVLTVPVGAFALEERHRIGDPGTRHLLHFDARVIDGSGPVDNQYWNHRVIKLANVRVGTPAELKEAEFLLASMERDAEQYRAAWERDVEERRRNTEMARISVEAAKQEAASGWAGTVTRGPEATTEAAGPAEPETKPEPTPAEPDSWSFRRADWLARVWPALGPIIGWEALAACVLGICTGIVQVKRGVVG